ncbi:MAG: hypothetical protein Q9173_007383, partial [Seirophora scorigena]
MLLPSPSRPKVPLLPHLQAPFLGQLLGRSAAEHAMPLRSARAAAGVAGPAAVGRAAEVVVPAHEHLAGETDLDNALMLADVPSSGKSRHRDSLTGFLVWVSRATAQARLWWSRVVITCVCGVMGDSGRGGKRKGVRELQGNRIEMVRSGMEEQEGV